MNLIDSEAYHIPTGSKYLLRAILQYQISHARGGDGCEDATGVGRPTLLCTKMSAVGQDVGEVKCFTDEDHSGGVLPTEWPTIDEKDDIHRSMTEVEPILGASAYRTRRNIIMTHREYPCHCLAQTLWLPKRGNLELIWDVEELYSTGLPDQNQPESIVVVSAMLAVRWLEANAGTSEQETTVPTPEQLSSVKLNNNLDLFRTTCKVLRIPRAIERIWARQRLMTRNTEAYQSFQLDIRPGAYKRAFLTHRNAVTTAVKRVAGAPCLIEVEKREVL